MKGMILVLVVAALTGSWPAAAEEQGTALTLPAAIDLALARSRRMQGAELERRKAEETLAAGQTRLWPTLQLTAGAVYLFTPLDFQLPQGVLGTYPVLGPVPHTDTTVEAPQVPVYTLDAGLRQPLSQLYRIHLALNQAELERDIAAEKQREERTGVSRDVKRLYFALQQTQSSLAVAGDAVRLYRETDRTTQKHLEEQTVLKSDALKVKAALAKAELDRLQLEDLLAVQKQQLNSLMGRELVEDFRVEDIAALADDAAPEAAEAQQRALQNRPEVREARLKADQAALDRRIKKAEFIPDVSLTLDYITVRNIPFTPENYFGAGVLLQWDLWDWGRKKHEMEARSRTAEQANLAVREAENAVVIDVDAKRRKLLQARQRVAIAEIALEASQENARVAESRYSEQAALLQDLLQAQTQLQQAQDDRSKAVLDYRNAQADFEQATGGEQ